MQNKKRFIIWGTITTLIIMIILTKQFISEIQWNETIAYIVIILAIACIYELYKWLKTHNRSYRIAFSIGTLGALLIIRVNGAVGIIGSEDNPANLMYWAVLFTIILGSLISTFKPRWMALTLFATAIVQILVPVFALFIWPAQTSWGEAGVIGVLVFNSVFAGIFIISALFFQRARLKE